MGTFEDAVAVCSALILIVFVPWGAIAYPAIAYPAIAQRFMGDYGPATLLVEQGFHWIAAFTVVLILLILLVGAWFN